MSVVNADSFNRFVEQLVAERVAELESVMQHNSQSSAAIIRDLRTELEAMKLKHSALVYSLQPLINQLVEQELFYEEEDADGLPVSAEDSKKRKRQCRLCKSIEHDVRKCPIQLKRERQALDEAIEDIRTSKAKSDQ
jgi:hypothetical protein